MPKTIPAATMQYCIDLVRRYDHDHFLCTILLPATTRVAAQVLRAFNVEISLIDRATTNSNAAMLRLQWWREAIAAAAGAQKIEHPVVEALGVLIDQHRLPMRWLNRIMESRDPDRTETPTTVVDLEAIAEASHSTLLYLTLHAGNIHDINADHAASHIGKAVGLVTALQALQFGYTANLPRKLLSDPHMKLAPGNEPLIDVVYQIASQAKAHLDHARSLRDAIPTAARPVLLPAVPADRFLDRLQKAQFDVFQTPSSNPLPTQMSLFRNWLLSRF